MKYARAIFLLYFNFQVKYKYLNEKESERELLQYYWVNILSASLSHSIANLFLSLK